VLFYFIQYIIPDPSVFSRGKGYDRAFSLGFPILINGKDFFCEDIFQVTYDKMVYIDSMRRNAPGRE
jgi:hypothetical protein